MKKRNLVTVFLGLQLLAGNVFADGKEIEVYVKGMVCSFCAQGIKKKLSAEKAVDKVDVNLGKHRVAVELKEGESLDDAKIAEILKDAGYSVEKIERK